MEEIAPFIVELKRFHNLLLARLQQEIVISRDPACPGLPWGLPWVEEPCVETLGLHLWNRSRGVWKGPNTSK